MAAENKRNPAEFCHNTIHGGDDLCVGHQPAVGKTHRIVFNGIPEDDEEMEFVEGLGPRNIWLCDDCVTKITRECAICGSSMTGLHVLPGFADYCADCINCTLLKAVMFHHKDAIKRVCRKYPLAKQKLDIFFTTAIDDDDEDACILNVLFNLDIKMPYISRNQTFARICRIIENDSVAAAVAEITLDDDVEMKDSQ